MGLGGCRRLLHRDWTDVLMGVKMMETFCLHCYPTDLKEARIYITSHNGRVLDYKQDGDWIAVRYLCDKEL